MGLTFTAFARPAAGETPAVTNVRNLALAGASRASSTGSQAAFVNPAGIAFSQQFSADAIYQLGVQGKLNGIAASVQDSLNNPHVAVALTYSFMKGMPQLRYTAADNQLKRLQLEHFGHEAAGILGVTAIRNWLYFGATLKYRYTSLRYRDDYKKGQEVLPSLNGFGFDVAAAFELAGFARITVVGYNLVGNHRPAYDEDHPLTLMGIATAPNTPVVNRSVSRISDYPLMIAHGLAVFPFRKPNFSINYDATYDLTSYRKSQDYTRITQAGGLEFQAGPVPLRAGARWDGMGKGKGDDRVFVGGGLGYVKAASAGNAGFEVGAALLQQVNGKAPLETQISLMVGLRLHPNF